MSANNSHSGSLCLRNTLHTFPFFLGTAIENFVLPVIKKYEKINKQRRAKSRKKKSKQSPTYVFPYSRVWNKHTPLNKRSPWKI